MIYGYLDESANLSDENFFFCVGIVFGDKKVERDFEHIIKKTRNNLKIYKKKFVSELKFNNSSDKLKKYIFNKIDKLNIKIVAVLVNKEGRAVKDSVDNYSLTIIQTVKELKDKTNLSLILDKKYTNFSQNMMLLSKLKKGQPSVLFSTADSQNNYGLQIADFVVGAVNYKYNRKDGSYYDIIKNKFVSEKVIKWTKIKKEDI